MPFSPDFTTTHAITSALTQIERARGFLEAAKLSDAWIRRMQERAFVLEAHHTTHIEGTHLTLDQSEKLLAGESVANCDPDDIQELLNYRKAFDLVASYLDDGDPITEGLVREIHKRLVKGVRGNAAAPGEYRKVQNYVANSRTGEVIYTPPPAYQVPLLMTDLTEWLRKNIEIHPVLVAGLAQFQLVDIHPFLDGNGRAARLLSTLCLYRSGYDFKRLFTISEYYDRDRPGYYHAIQSVRDGGMDLTPWLEYFTQGLASQMQEVEQRGKELAQLSVSSIDKPLTPRQQTAIELALARGKFTMHDLSEVLPNTSVRTLQRDLKELIERSLIVQEGATNQRIYKLSF